MSSLCKTQVTISENPIAFKITPIDENPYGIVLHDPPRNQEKIKIWKNQMLIPFSISEQTMSFLGPYLTSKMHSDRVSDFFPCFIQTMHVAFE